MHAQPDTAKYKVLDYTAEVTWNIMSNQNDDQHVNIRDDKNSKDIGSPKGFSSQ